MIAVQKNKVLVSFWGTRGALPVTGRSVEKYGGDTACVSVSCGSEVFVFDAGSGIRDLGEDLAEEVSSGKVKRISLFLSHMHFDHILGLPFFKPLRQEGVAIDIYVSAYKTGIFEQLFLDNAKITNELLPVTMVGAKAELSLHELLSSEIKIGNALIRWQEQVQHPGGSVRYRLDLAGRTFIYATDVELDRFYADPGERSQVDRYLNFIDNADMLVGDGQFGDREYQNQRDTGHSSVPVLIEAAELAKVKKLAVFHHDPACTDDIIDGFQTRYGRKAAPEKSEMEIFWARQGLTVAI